MQISTIRLVFMKLQMEAFHSLKLDLILPFLKNNEKQKYSFLVLQRQKAL